MTATQKSDKKQKIFAFKKIKKKRKEFGFVLLVLCVFS